MPSYCIAVYSSTRFSLLAKDRSSCLGEFVYSAARKCIFRSSFVWHCYCAFLAMASSLSLLQAYHTKHTYYVKLVTHSRQNAVRSIKDVVTTWFKAYFKLCWFWSFSPPREVYVEWILYQDPYAISSNIAANWHAMIDIILKFSVSEWFFWWGELGAWHEIWTERRTLLIDSGCAICTCIQAFSWWGFQFLKIRNAVSIV